MHPNHGELLDVHFQFFFAKHRLMTEISRPRPAAFPSSSA